MIALFPEIIQCCAQKDLEKLAILVRRYFGGSDATSPRLDLKMVVQAFGAKVVFSSQSYWGALVTADDQGKLSLVFSIRHHMNPTEERFLLAHLLGYFLLEIQPQLAQGSMPSTLSYKVEESPLGRFEQRDLVVGYTPKEILQADDFAVGLLLPKAMVLRASVKLKNLDQIAQFFGLTKASVEKRILLLNAEAQKVTVQTSAAKPSPDVVSQPQPQSQDQAPVLSDKKEAALKRIRALAQQLQTSKDKQP